MPGQLVVHASLRRARRPRPARAQAPPQPSPVASQLARRRPLEVVVRLHADDVRVRRVELLQPHGVVPLLGSERGVREPSAAAQDEAQDRAAEVPVEDRDGPPRHVDGLRGSRLLEEVEVGELPLHMAPRPGAPAAAPRPPARRPSVHQPPLLRLRGDVDRTGGREQRAVPPQDAVVEVVDRRGVRVEQERRSEHQYLAPGVGARAAPARRAPPPAAPATRRPPRGPAPVAPQPARAPRGVSVPPSTRPFRLALRPESEGPPAPARSRPPHRQPRPPSAPPSLALATAVSSARSTGFPGRSRAQGPVGGDDGVARGFGARCRVVPARVRDAGRAGGARGIGLGPCGVGWDRRGPGGAGEAEVRRGGGVGGPGRGSGQGSRKGGEGVGGAGEVQVRREELGRARGSDAGGIPWRKDPSGVGRGG